MLMDLGPKARVRSAGGRCRVRGAGVELRRLQHREEEQRRGEEPGTARLPKPGEAAPTEASGGVPRVTDVSRAVITNITVGSSGVAVGCGSRLGVCETSRQETRPQPTATGTSSEGPGHSQKFGREAGDLEGRGEPKKETFLVFLL